MPDREHHTRSSSQDAALGGLRKDAVRRDEKFTQAARSAKSTLVINKQPAR